MSFIVVFVYIVIHYLYYNIDRFISNYTSRNMDKHICDMLTNIRDTQVSVHEDIKNNTVKLDKLQANVKENTVKLNSHTIKLDSHSIVLHRMQSDIRKLQRDVNDNTSTLITRETSQANIMEAINSLTHNKVSCEERIDA